MHQKDWFLRALLALLTLGVWALAGTSYLKLRLGHINPSVTAEREALGSATRRPAEYERLQVRTLVVPSRGLHLATPEGKVLAELSADRLGGHLRVYDEGGKVAWAAPTGAQRAGLTESEEFAEGPAAASKPTRVENVLQVEQVVVPQRGLRFVTPEGKTVASIAANKHGGAFAVWHRAGGAVITLSAEEDGPWVWLTQPSGAPAVQMRVHRDWGGSLTVFDGDGRSAVSLLGNRAGGGTDQQLGGQITVWGPHQEVRWSTR